MMFARSALAATALSALIATARDPQRYKAEHAPRGTPRRLRGRTGRGMELQRLRSARRLEAGTVETEVPLKHLHSHARRMRVLGRALAAARAYRRARPGDGRACAA